MEEVYKGAIALFYKDQDKHRAYLVVENTKTGNFTFIGGAFEKEDKTLEDTAKREIREELGLEPGGYTLVPLSVHHEFVFGPEKKDRAGHKGRYQVFAVDASHLDLVRHTNELKSAKWMKEDEVARALNFPDLREVFEKAITEVNGLGLERSLNRHETLYMKTETSKSFELAKAFLGKEVEVVMDRPLGSKHPKHGFEYEANYGFIEGIKAPDGEDLDAYYLGVTEPLERATGVCIAIAHRKDNDDDKLVVVPAGKEMTDEQIIAAIHFQERWFDTEIVRSDTG